MSETGPTTRIEVRKTYKLYIGGAFPRTESGRYYGPDGFGQMTGGPTVVNGPKRARDTATALALWDAAERLTGASFPTGPIEKLSGSAAVGG